MFKVRSLFSKCCLLIHNKIRYKTQYKFTVLEMTTEEEKGAYDEFELSPRKCKILKYKNIFYSIIFLLFVLITWIIAILIIVGNKKMPITTNTVQQPIYILPPNSENSNENVRMNFTDFNIQRPSIDPLIDKLKDIFSLNTTEIIEKDCLIRTGICDCFIQCIDRKDELCGEIPTSNSFDVHWAKYIKCLLENRREYIKCITKCNDNFSMKC